ncbi:response regulator [Spirosoma harenae]
MNDQLVSATTNINFKNAKALVIEDCEDHWSFIKRAMERVLPEIALERAATLSEALTVLKGWANEEWEIPKIILQDLYLPTRQDGLQLLQQIKALGLQYSRIPIVVLSSSFDQDDIGQAYQYGASSYLVKPTIFSDWLTHVQELRAYWWETVTLPPLYFA